MVKLIQNECTSDEEGVPVCNNKQRFFETIDGIRTERSEVCQDCKLDLADIGYENLCEENNLLKTAMIEVEAEAIRAAEDLEITRTMVDDIIAARDDFIAERNREQ